MYIVIFYYGIRLAATYAASQPEAMFEIPLGNGHCDEEFTYPSDHEILGNINSYLSFVIHFIPHYIGNSHLYQIYNCTVA